MTVIKIICAAVSYNTRALSFWKQYFAFILLLYELLLYERFSMHIRACTYVCIFSRTPFFGTPLIFFFLKNRSRRFYKSKPRQMSTCPKHIIITSEQWKVHDVLYTRSRQIGCRFVTPRNSEYDVLYDEPVEFTDTRTHVLSFSFLYHRHINRSYILQSKSRPEFFSSVQYWKRVLILLSLNVGRQVYI